MKNFPSLIKNRYPWTDCFAALAIVVGAVLTCVLSVANGNAGACAGVLLVFGMALTAVLGGRSEVRMSSPIQRHRALEMRTVQKTGTAGPLAASFA